MLPHKIALDFLDQNKSRYPSTDQSLLRDNTPIVRKDVKFEYHGIAILSCFRSRIFCPHGLRESLVKQSFIIMRELQMSKFEPIECLRRFFSCKNIPNTTPTPVRARLRQSVGEKGTTLRKRSIETYPSLDQTCVFT